MSHTFAICKNCHAANKIQTDKAREAICGKCKTPIPFHGLVMEVTTDEFNKLLRISDKPVIADFWASWCGPCKMYGPEFEKASLKSTDAVFVKINTEVEVNLSGSLGIRGIPCTIIFKDGREIKRQSGAMDASGVGELLRSL